MDNLYIIAGLGNPGSRYDSTRHNVGFLAIDLLSSQYSIPVNKLKFKALIGEGSINGKRVLLVKPQTFMNLSGESIREIIEWYKADLSKLIIIYDDVDLDPGKIRIRPKGSAGTHNGMRSVIYQIQKEDFPRVRIGIGRPPQGWELKDFVLAKVSKQDGLVLQEGIEMAAAACSEILSNGLDSAMNKYNNK